MRKLSSQAQPQLEVAPSFVRRERGRHWIALVITLLVAFALRVYHLGTQALWWDESLTYTRAVSDLLTVLTNQITIQSVVTRDLHPPLYFLILHLIVPLIGVSEYALRFLSTFANVLSLPLIYLLTRRWFSARTALVSVGVAALSPFYVYYSQEARPYAPVLFFSLLALLYLNKFTSSHSPLYSFGLYLVSVLAMLGTMYLSFLLLPFHSLFIFLALRSSPATFRFRGFTVRRQYLAFVTVAVFVVLFLFIPFISAGLAGSESAGPQFVPWLVLLRDALNSFSVGVTANIEQTIWFDLALLALFAVGLLGAWQRSDKHQFFYILLAYLFTPILALQLGSYLRPLYMNSRHLLVASPPFYIGVALGIVTLMRNWKTMAFAVIASVLIVFADALSLGNLYFNSAYAKDDQRAWVEYLATHVRAGDGLILVAPQAETIVEYYAPDLLPWISLPNLVADQNTQQRLDNRAVAQAYQKWSRIWLLELHAPVADPDRHISELLRRFGTRLDRIYFRGLSTEIILSDFVPDTPFTNSPPTPSHPLERRFNNELDLLGYDAPTRANIGERTPAHFFWKMLKPTGQDYATSLLVKDEAGQVWGQTDELLLGNLWPTSNWEPDQIASEVHDIYIDPAAPPGEYRIELQVYRRNTGERLAAPVALGVITATRPPVGADPRKFDFARVPGTDLSPLEFVGYNLDVASALPGDTVPLVLYFKLNAVAPERISGRVSLAHPFFTFWDFDSTPFEFSTRGKEIGDYIRVRVNTRISPELGPGNYQVTLALDGHPFVRTDLDTLHVESLTRVRTLPPAARATAARFGDSIELAGYQMTQASDRLNLTLYWRARTSVEKSYTVFTHVLETQNHVLAQSDSIPVAGERPTTSWTRGEVIEDTYELELPANLAVGDYPVEIGLYDAVNGARLPVFVEGQSNGDRFLLDPLKIR